MSKSRKFAELLSKIFLVGFCILVVGSFSELYKTYRTNKLNEELRSKAEKFATNQTTSGEWHHPLLLENEDYVGWLTVFGTNADGPVVQGENNTEYLRTDFHHNKSVGGTLFMDETVDVTEENGNRIIYGHLMKDNTMFGDFKKYKNVAFFKENNIVRWQDRFGESYYRLFAAILCSGSVLDDNYLNIQQWAHHLNEDETQDMLATLQDRAFLFSKKENRGENQYMFLVTCEYSQTAGKLVLVAERINNFIGGNEDAG